MKFGIAFVWQCVLSKDPDNLFGYERLGFHEDVRYDELSSAESGIEKSRQRRRQEVAQVLHKHMRRVRQGSGLRR